MTTVHLRLVTTEVDYEVEFDRVPVVGEVIHGPDDMPPFVVRHVDWRFPKGFGMPGQAMVVAHPGSTPQQTREGR
jgi:hypothetical protein